MVLVAENIAKYGIFVLARILYQAHCDTAHGLLHGHTCIHQGKRTGAYGGHRRRTVALKYLRHETHSVGEFCWNLVFQGAPGQVSVANLAAAYAALCLCLARTERWEIVVQQEAHVTLVENIVNHLLVELRTERTGGERLRFAAREDGTSVRHGQGTHLAPYRSYLVSLASVETDALVKDATAHGVAHNVMVVAFHHGGFLFQLVFCQVGVGCVVCLLEVTYYLVKGILACLFVECLLCNVVCLLVKLVVHLLAQVFVVHLVVIFALYILAQFF